MCAAQLVVSYLCYCTQSAEESWYICSQRENFVMIERAIASLNTVPIYSGRLALELLRTKDNYAV